MRLIHYPSIIGDNQYLERQKKVWEACGLNPMAWTALLKPLEFLKAILCRHENLANVNWLEDRIGYRKRPVWVELGYSLFVLGILKITAARVIWTRHNAAPHRRDHSRLAYRIICKALALVSDVIVVHAKREGVRYDFLVPHPLYEDVIPPVETRARRFLIIGGVKRYKEIHTLFRYWPSDRPLTVAGRCRDEDLRDELKSLITSRQLAVDWIDRYIEEAEMCSLLKSSSCLVIPNADRSMIASGTFFHAAAYGLAVLCRESSFSRYISEAYSFVTEFVPERIEDSIREAGRQSNKAQIQAEMFSKNCTGACANGWRIVLESLR